MNDQRDKPQSPIHWDDWWEIVLTVVFVVGAAGIIGMLMEGDALVFRLMAAPMLIVIAIVVLFFAALLIFSIPFWAWVIIVLLLILIAK